MASNEIAQYADVLLEVRRRIVTARSRAARGFSRTNLHRMLAFYRAYKGTTEFVPQAVGQMDGSCETAVSELLLKVPRGHHATVSTG